MSALQYAVSTSKLSLKSLDAIQWVFLLVLRLWLAKVFFLSGLTKIQSWETTLMLFEYEYAVPLLSPYFAAVLATIAELIIPIALVLGLFTRLTIIALFLLNLVAAISYPDISPAGVKDHLIWALACIVLFFYGPGLAALDYFIRRKWFE
ncbi:MAG: DoxX family protein [Pseudomonadales bacterium]|nr:DoxX family protein [Pseudomonadales bacterium]